MDRGGKGKWWKFERLVQSFNGIICGNFLRTNLSPKNWITKSLVGPIIVHHKFHIYCQSVTDYNFISTVGCYWLYIWGITCILFLSQVYLIIFFTTVYKRESQNMIFCNSDLQCLERKTVLDLSFFCFSLKIALHWISSHITQHFRIIKHSEYR